MDNQVRRVASQMEYGIVAAAKPLTATLCIDTQLAASQWLVYCGCPRGYFASAYM